MAIHILVAEDDENIRGMTCRFLERAGYAVDSCVDGNDALAQLLQKTYQLAILDIMLPGADGLSVLQALRKTHDTPVLMMTALSDDASQLAAFAGEADDYVVKPFSMPILLMRAEALLRRSGALRKEIKAGRLTLLPESCGVLCDGDRIQLSPKEFDILRLLAQNKNQIVPHETMLVRIWGYDFDGNEGIIHASMKKLRDKLPGNLIRTVKSVGYCLEVEAGDRE